MSEPIPPGARVDAVAAGPTRRIPLPAVLSLALINVLWAGSAVAAKFAFGHHTDSGFHGIGPFTLAFVRFAPAGALLYLLVRVRGERVTVARSDRLPLFLLGLFGITITYAVFYGGMRYTTASETSLLFASEPVLLAVMALVLLRERMANVQLVGMVVGFAGVYVVVMEGIAPRVSGEAIANCVVLASMVFECYAGIVAKRLTSRYAGLAVLAYEFLIGSALLLPFAVTECVRRPPTALGMANVAAVVYLSLVCSFMCYGIWYVMLSRMNLSAMASFLFIQPVTGPLFGHLLLGDRLMVWTAAGAGMVLVGVWMVAIVPHKRTHR